MMKQLFTEETVQFTGKYYTITEMKGYPRPVQKPHLPILVAGAGERMLKLAAREADIVAIGSKITGKVWTRQTPRWSKRLRGSKKLQEALR